MIHKYKVGNYIKDISGYKPKFKKGQIIILDISYDTVIYRIDDIINSNDGYYYKLIGLVILKDDGTNPYKTETRNYNPYAFFVDKEMKLFNGDLKTLTILYGKIE